MSGENTLKIVLGRWYTRHQPLPIEEQLERTFPDGQWVETDEHAPDQSLPGSPASTTVAERPALTVIGGTKFDEENLDAYLAELTFYKPDVLLVTGSGRGVEKHVAEIAEEHGIDIDIIETDSKKIEVEAVMAARVDSPVLLVGDGTRVKQARSWLARANWGREVTEL